MRRVLLLILAMAFVCCGTQGFTRRAPDLRAGFVRVLCVRLRDDAVGFATISEAIDDFRSQSEGDWHYREDWHSLTPGDMSTTPVEFTDERGWTYLAVHLIQWNDTWLVGHYESCAST